MGGFVDKQDDFVLNAVLDWEPVKVMENGSNMIPEPGISEDSYS